MRDIFLQFSFICSNIFSDGFTCRECRIQSPRCIKHCRVENRYFLYKHKCTAVDFPVFVTNCNILGNPTLFNLCPSADCIKFPYLLFLQNSSYSLISIKNKPFVSVSILYKRLVSEIVQKCIIVVSSAIIIKLFVVYFAVFQKRLWADVDAERFGTCLNRY